MSRLSAACFGLIFSVSLSAMCLFSGCGKGTSTSPGTKPEDVTVIRVEGSDTMANLAQAWSEEYRKLHPEITVQVSGVGSGVGIASLIDGVTDLANSSRKMKDKELARAKENTGKDPVEHVVGLDALAVYVKADNPLETITIAQLAEIYGENGTIAKWSQLNTKVPGCSSDEITRVSRQNNSGTYYYFREAILGTEREFKLGSLDQSGSKDVVALVSETPCAIGYSGMGYRTAGVKWLKVAKDKDTVGVEPSIETASDGSYPIARPLLIYTLGEPTGVIKDYLDWIASPAGQQIVLDLGYVPMGPIASDSATPDSATPDSATPDSATPDSATPPETTPAPQQ